MSTIDFLALYIELCLVIEVNRVLQLCRIAKNVGSTLSEKFEVQVGLMQYGRMYQEY